MKPATIEITDNNCKDFPFKADFKNLSGMPCIGEGRTPEQAVACLFLRLHRNKTPFHDALIDWRKEIVIVNEIGSNDGKDDRIKYLEDLITNNEAVMTARKNERIECEKNTELRIENERLERQLAEMADGEFQE